MPPELSICIPTRNRAPFLRQCLSHLKGFTRLRAEVIVFDNASDDGTADVAREFQKNAFAQFLYHRHAEDVGVARNMDAALRLARAPFLWVLSDDDIAYESGLQYLIACLTATPSAVAACGGYATVHRMAIGSDRFTAPESIAAIGRGDLAALAANVLVTDGHPVMRRDIFQRHCRMEERGFGLLPLYGQLLRHGEVLHTSQPVMEHLTNPDSLSTRLTEPWFMDFVTADVEIAMAGGAQPVALELLDRAKNSIHGMAYLQAARMARIQGDALLTRHFLLRARATHMIDDASLVHWEAAFLLDAAVQRLAQVLRDIGSRKLTLEPQPALQRIAQQLETMLPEVRILAPGARGAAGAGRQDAHLQWTPLGAHGPAAESVPTAFSFLEIVEACRVAPHPFTIELDAEGNGTLRYREPHVVQMLDTLPQGFQIVMSDYRMA
jgi:glycosyltransferase involved in cell wall biosynthesis